MTDAGLRHQMEESVKRSPDALTFRQTLWSSSCRPCPYITITGDFDRPEGYQHLGTGMSEMDTERGCSIRA